MILENAMKIPTLEEWLVDDLPHATFAMWGEEDRAREVSESCYHEHVAKLQEARTVLENLGLSRNQLDQLATTILLEDA